MYLCSPLLQIDWKQNNENTSNKIPGRWAGSFVQHFNLQNKYVCMLCRGTNMGVVFSKKKNFVVKK